MISNGERGLYQAMERWQSDGVEPSRHSQDWLAYRAREVFGDVPLAGRSLMEIGSGSGLFCLWAASQGAGPVIGLEPETDGATSGTAEAFRQLIREAGYQDVQCVGKTFQDWDPAGQLFDVVLSYNSINHLDEPSCVNLLRDPAARAVYRSLFQKIAACVRPGGHFILWEVAPRNLWRALGMPHLIERTLEWEKHQSPEVWRALLRETGFGEFQLSWPAYYPLRRLGPLIENRLGAYAVGSRFRLQARRLR